MLLLAIAAACADQPVTPLPAPGGAARALGVSSSDPHLVTLNTLGALSAHITGDTYLLGGDVGVWDANATGGNGTYTYQWQYMVAGAYPTGPWTNVGTLSSYYRRSGRYGPSFLLRVIVTSDGVSYTSSILGVSVEPNP
jgi:hypothetical protein